MGTSYNAEVDTTHTFYIASSHSAPSLPFSFLKTNDATKNPQLKKKREVFAKARFFSCSSERQMGHFPSVDRHNSVGKIAVTQCFKKFKICLAKK